MRRSAVARMLAGFFVLALGAIGAGREQAPARDGSTGAPSIGTAVVAGRVMTEDAPVRRAHVTLRDESGNISATTTTDDAGRFAFTAIAAGRYVIASSKIAFVDTLYGASGTNPPGTTVALADGQHVDDLTLRMARGASITGRASGAVHVLRVGCSARTGARTLEMPATEFVFRSEDSGTYRAFGLPAGEYIVEALGVPTSAVPAPPGEALDIYRGTVDLAQALALTLPDAGRDPGAARGASRNEPTVTYAPVYYPGATDVSGAATVAVAAGEERSGIDVPAQLVEAARIDGVVRGARGAATSLTVSLTRKVGPELLGTTLVPARTTDTDASGAFHFSAVAPGEYTAFVGAWATAAASTRSDRHFAQYARADVVVDGRDLRVDLDLQPTITMIGQLVFSGSASRPPPADLAQLRVLLRPVDEGLDVPSTAPTTDGRIEFGGLMPGRYLLSLDASTRLHGWWLKSATAQNTDVIDAPLVVGPSANVGDLTLVFTDRPSALTGRLRDSANRPVTNVSMVVFPMDRALWGRRSSRVRVTRPATDGTYEFVNLPAGDYRIAAVTAATACDLGDAAFLDDVSRNAMSVTLADGERRTLDLRTGGGR